MGAIDNINACFDGSFLVWLLFLGIGGQVPVAMAQSGGTFSATGNLNTARRSHTATLLTNGKVLVAGAPIIWRHHGQFSPALNFTTL
jgi:hypothetical protein